MAILFEARAQAVGSDLPGGILLDAQSLGEGRAEQGVAECGQAQREGGLGDLLLIVADAELSDEAADRVRGLG